MADPVSRAVRNACDIVGSTISVCATNVAKSVRRAEQQVKTSHMLGRFVVTGAEQFLRSKFGPSATSASPSAPTGHHAATEDNSAKQPADPAPSEVLAPLDDYDLLTSAQVVELLATMSAAERQRVWEYENAHRRRRTILESSRTTDGS